MTTDVLIVGAGHNGLVCAYYLASAGLKVKLVEKRVIVAGAAVTEEFHPGFRNSVAAYTVSPLNPKVIEDMDLSAHGLTVVERRASNFLTQPDGGYLLTRVHLRAHGRRYFPRRHVARPAFLCAPDVGPCRLRQPRQKPLYVICAAREPNRAAA